MSTSRREEIERKYKKKSRTKWVLVLLLLLALTGIALNYDVVVRWFTTPPSITVDLTHPPQNHTIATNTTYFNWNGSGGDGTPLRYVWYSDIDNNFNTPYLRTINMDTSVNHTPAPFLDGEWYWRVEATDNSTVTVSDTQRFVIWNHTSNNFPELYNYSVNPLAGYNTTNFVYSVYYRDSDNDTADFIHIYINQTYVFNMTEADPSDTDVTDGKLYTYTTTLPTGVHNYTIICSDGYTLVKTPIFWNPSVTAYTPPSPPPGGPSSPERLHKLTIYPDQTTVSQGTPFTGLLVIIEEGFGVPTEPVEVYWYVSLLDENGTEVSSTSGATALYINTQIPYRLTTKLTTPPGSYRIYAKTFDSPRENIDSKQLGMDEKPVTVEQFLELLPFMSLLDELGVVGQVGLVLSLFVASLLLLFFGYRRKKYLFIILAATLIMVNLLIIGIVPYHSCPYSILGIPLVALGGYLLTPYRVKLIKRKHLAIAIGVLLSLAGFFIYTCPFHGLF